MCGRHNKKMILMMLEAIHYFITLGTERTTVDLQRELSMENDRPAEDSTTTASATTTTSLGTVCGRQDDEDEDESDATGSNN
jgi:hypothetical protein